MPEKLHPITPVPARSLHRSTRWVLVGLRIYVLAMMLLFLYKFALVLHAR